MKAEDIKAGWRIVTGILVCLVVARVLEVLLLLLVGIFPLSSLIGLGLTAWLGWQVYQGKLWARLWLGATLVLGSLFMLLSGGLGLAFGLVNLLFAIALFAVPQVNTYFEFASNQ